MASYPDRKWTNGKRQGPMSKGREGAWPGLQEELPGTLATHCPQCWAARQVQLPGTTLNSTTHIVAHPRHESGEDAFGTHSQGPHCWVPQSRGSLLSRQTERGATLHPATPHRQGSPANTEH